MSDNTKKTVLSLMKAALFGAPLSLPDPVDWKAAARESVAQSVTVLAYEAAKRTEDADGLPACQPVGAGSHPRPASEGSPHPVIPPDVGSAWKNAVNAVTRRNIRVEAEHAELHLLLTGNSVPYVVLKGCASAMYYPEPFLRQLGDVDFLVAPEDVCRADGLLKANGFTYKESSNTDERIYVRGKSVWELHTAANGTPGGEVGDRVRALMSDAIEKAVFYKAPSSACGEGGLPAEPGEGRGGGSPRSFSSCNDTCGSFLVPSEFHHGLVLLLHTARHMTTGGVGLRQICDWAVFAAHMGDRFPEVFEEKLRSVGLWKLACVLTQLSSEYLGAPKQAWAGEPDLGLLAALMDDIFAGGNFGDKDKARRDQAKFITDRKSGGAASRTAAGQAVRSANEIVRRHWPAAGKLPFLYPFGWAFFGGRYALRAALGKRERIDVRSLSRGAKERREVYGKLELFK